MQTSPSPTLYSLIQATFCVIVVVSNVISAKLFEVPFFDNLLLPAGLLTYPLTFLLSDLTTELYGAKQAKHMVYTALGLTILCYFVIQLSIFLPTQDLEQQKAFQMTLGLNGLIIGASLTAYVIAQVLDIQLYALIKGWTNGRFLWLRNNGSTLASQIVDTLTVNMIHLYWGLGMELSQVFHIMLFSYTYKAVFSIANTPLFYALLYLIKKEWTIPGWILFLRNKFDRQEPINTIN